MEILLLFILVIFLLYSLFSTKARGRAGEKKVASLLSSLPQEYEVFNDLLIEDNGRTSQIDHLIVSVYGIFVIETKNYSGFITGYENSRQWTENFYGNKYYFYNPIKQNKGHILALRNKLHIIEDDFIPIVVFSDDCTLQVDTQSPVIYMSDMIAKIKSYNEIKFDISQIKFIAEQIVSADINSDVAAKQHVEEIRDNLTEEMLNLSNGICPRCGAPLVLRQGRYGNFYGCSNYPKCHYTHSAEL